MHVCQLAHSLQHVSQARGLITSQVVHICLDPNTLRCGPKYYKCCSWPWSKLQSLTHIYKCGLPPNHSEQTWHISHLPWAMCLYAITSWDAVEVGMGSLVCMGCLAAVCHMRLTSHNTSTLLPQKQKACLHCLHNPTCSDHWSCTTYWASCFRLTCHPTLTGTLSSLAVIWGGC